MACSRVNFTFIRNRIEILLLFLGTGRMHDVEILSLSLTWRSQLELGAATRMGSHVKCPLLLSHFNEKLEDVDKFSVKQYKIIFFFARCNPNVACSNRAIYVIGWLSFLLGLLTHEDGTDTY